MLFYRGKTWNEGDLKSVINLNVHVFAVSDVLQEQILFPLLACFYNYIHFAIKCNLLNQRLSVIRLSLDGPGQSGQLTTKYLLHLVLLRIKGVENTVPYRLSLLLRCCWHRYTHSLL